MCCSLKSSDKNNMFYVTVGFVSDQVVVRLETNPISFFSFSLLPFRIRVAKVINHISGPSQGLKIRGGA